MKCKFVHYVCCLVSFFRGTQNENIFCVDKQFILIISQAKISKVVYMLYNSFVWGTEPIFKYICSSNTALWSNEHVSSDVWSLDMQE